MVPRHLPPTARGSVGAKAHAGETDQWRAEKLLD